MNEMKVAQNDEVLSYQNEKRVPGAKFQCEIQLLVSSVIILYILIAP